VIIATFYLLAVPGDCSMYHSNLDHCTQVFFFQVFIQYLKIIDVVINGLNMQAHVATTLYMAPGVYKLNVNLVSEV